MNVKEIIKIILEKIGLDSSKRKGIKKCLLKKDIAVNVNNAEFNKRCLLIYITSPFFNKNYPEIHQNLWQVKELAKMIGEYRYTVDVIDYDNSFIKLKHKYDLIIGLIPRGIDVYSHHMNPGCRKIAYLTSSNIAFTNAAESERMKELEERRGYHLKLRRQSKPISREIEQFDAAFFIGSRYNLQTYHSFRMPPVYFIKNNGYEMEVSIDFTVKSPKNFLFFASAGQVHKGLDLLLEIFAKEGFLYICSHFEQEKDFCEAYNEELFHRSNIHPIGFVEILSAKFKEIVSRCCYIIMPSCAEGMAGSVLTAMSAGLIPIVSRECGFEDEDVIHLPDCRLETIERYIYEFGNKDKQWIIEASEKARKVVLDSYSKKNYIESVAYALNDVLGENKND